VDNPLERDAAEFDRRWNELAGLLESEMGAGPESSAAPDRPAGQGGGASTEDQDGSDAEGNEPQDLTGGDAAARGPLVTPGPDSCSDSVRGALTDLASGRDPWAVSAGPDSPLGGPRDWDPPEVEDHFSPPVAPPVTAGEPLLVIAWTATGLGLIGLALLVVLHPAVPWFLPRALALLAAAGIATLIWRMPHKRSDPDDPGAQV
jgi:hypothetical protein